MPITPGNVAEVIRLSAQSPEGLAALTLIILAFIALKFFANSGAALRSAVFLVLLFAGLGSAYYSANKSLAKLYPQNPVVVHSLPKTSGAMAGWSPWYEVCADTPIDTTVTTVRFSLSGDRTSCGVYSQCREKSRTATRVCYEFQLQGHNEWNPPGQGTSEGTLEVGWAPRQ